MKEKRLMIQTEVYSRVVGYFRPVNQWNKGKQEEFSERKEYVFDSALMENEYSLNEYKRAV
ncbi:MAG TPA: anaerobic ribonucleoside-triphosphate reductase [Spirochaetota bacterium]|nr:anaerobic ribonucleoside-triphosphate reductase [Spirochaetota bacterium]HPS88217.1 anaerobic ribonucleoside-triphosphate reductase [Spirochaetota bacterium]